jgi:hypothetical protein
LALLRTKLHFGLLHILNVFFGPASTLQRFNDSTVHVTEGLMLNAVLSLPAEAGEDSLLAKTFAVRSLDATIHEEFYRPPYLLRRPESAIIF